MEEDKDAIRNILQVSEVKGRQVVRATIYGGKEQEGNFRILKGQSVEETTTMVQKTSVKGKERGCYQIGSIIDSNILHESIHNEYL